MRKKGAGGTHLEFVLSFVIFVMFLVFLYGGIEPIVQTAGSKQFVLGHIRTSLVENFTLSDFTIQTFTIQLDQVNYNGNSDLCVKVNGGELNNLAEDKNLTIKNSSGGILSYNYDKGNGNLFIAPIPANEEDFDGYLKIYYASEFQNRSPHYGKENAACKLIIGNSDYEIRSITESEIISQSNIFDICRAYDSPSGYDGLKDSLGVPAGSDFSFMFRDADGIDVCPANPINPPQGVNIYASQIPIQYVDADATTKIGFIVLSVW